MKVIYMDESTRDFLHKPQDAIFIYGALTISKDKVTTALEIYKDIFKEARKKISKGLKESAVINALDTDARATAIGNVLKKFEIHSYEFFNPQLNDTNKRGEVIRYNPWQFIENSDRMAIIEDLFQRIKPCISDIFMFHIHNKTFDGHFPDHTIKEKTALANKYITQFVLEELSSTYPSEKVFLVMDNLDSEIRDSFVEESGGENYPNLWAEPIIVESHKNAFIQLIDLFTYVFYLDYSDKFVRRRLKRVRNAYRSQIKDLITTKDLFTHPIFTGNVSTGSAAGTSAVVAPGATTPLTSNEIPVAGRRPETITGNKNQNV